MRLRFLLPRGPVRGSYISGGINEVFAQLATLWGTFPRESGREALRKEDVMRVDEKSTMRIEKLLVYWVDF